LSKIEHPYNYLSITLFNLAASIADSLQHNFAILCLFIQLFVFTAGIADTFWCSLMKSW